MPADPDVITNFAGWVPELELGDVAKRLQNIHTYLSKLDDTYETIAGPLTTLTAQIEVNTPPLLQALKEIIDQVQKQDSLDLGDPDINEEVVATLQNVALNVRSAMNAINFASESLTEMASEVDEANEAIADLAEHVANY